MSENTEILSEGYEAFARGDMGGPSDPLRAPGPRRSRRGPAGAGPRDVLARSTNRPPGGVEAVYPGFAYFNEVDRELFSAELRAAFRALR